MFFGAFDRLFGWRWADPIAALVMVPVIAKEGAGVATADTVVQDLPDGEGIGRVSKNYLWHHRKYGRVAERLMAAVLKTANGESRSWVQIPPLPPERKLKVQL
jgi:hypothetical protein